MNTGLKMITAMSFGNDRNRRNELIEITIIWEGEEYEIKTFPNEYRSLMMLIYDRIGPDEFGVCLGMGKCATCLVEVLNSNENLMTFDRNETATLKKHEIQDPGFRLSCQLQVDENMHGVKFRII